MKKLAFFLFSLFTSIHSFCSAQISPNDFKGSDTKRIQSAIDHAAKTTHEVIISTNKRNGQNYWLIDEAILLPGNMKIVLKDCILQLSDSSRDNLFRSSNLIIGSKEKPTWIKNIEIVGIGKVVLKGANNPRSTGDCFKPLSIDPSQHMENPKGHSGFSTYGTDAEKPDRRQKGDWRNIMTLFAYVDGIKINNISLVSSHSWAMSYERVLNTEINNTRFESAMEQLINGKYMRVLNRDGIDIMKGCKHFRLNNITGYTQDDFIALNGIGQRNTNHRIGDFEDNWMITNPGWYGEEDNIEDIVVNNIFCKSGQRAIGIRSADSARIQKIKFQNVVCESAPNNTIMIGAPQYDKPSLPGMINHIDFENVIGKGRELVLIEWPITDCVFRNLVYTGSGDEIIRYQVVGGMTKNIKEINMVTARE